MIDESLKKFWDNVGRVACGLATCLIFLRYAKRGKILVKRTRLKKNRGYIRLSRLYHKRIKESGGIEYCLSCFELTRLEFWRKLNIKVNFIPKRFKRRVLPWRLIRR